MLSYKVRVRTAQRLSRVGWVLATGLALAVAVVTTLKGARAAAFFAASTATSATFSDIPGQAFSPAVQGDGTGLAPTSGPVRLVSFGFGFAGPVDAGGLYVFDRAYAGTPEGLAALTPGGPEGLLGRSTAVAGGVWAFDLILADAAATYFAYTDVQAGYLSHEAATPADSAYGGAALTAFYADGPQSPFADANALDEDVVFAAGFELVPEPRAAAALCTGMLCFAAVRRRRARAAPSRINRPDRCR